MLTACVENELCDQTGPLEYSYRIAELSCQEWHDVTEEWSSDGCQLQPGSTPNRVRFRSNLFGSLGAGLTIAPNTIDFNEVFTNVDKKLAEVKNISKIRHPRTETA